MARTLSPVARDRILAAAHELLIEDGIESFTVDAVAHRSGVAKTTIYRHFASAHELLVGALDSMIEPVATPDTGSLRGDLLDLFSQRLPIANDPRLRLLVLGILSAGTRDPELAPVYEAMKRQRTDPLHTVVERAAARGEIRPDVPADRVVDLIEGPLFLRIFVRQETMTVEDLEAGIDLALAAVAP